MALLRTLSAYWNILSHDHPGSPETFAIRLKSSLGPRKKTMLSKRIDTQPKVELEGDLRLNNWSYYCSVGATWSQSLIGASPFPPQSNLKPKSHWSVSLPCELTEWATSTKDKSPRVRDIATIEPGLITSGTFHESEDESHWRVTNLSSSGKIPIIFCAYSCTGQPWDSQNTVIRPSISEATVGTVSWICDRGRNLREPSLHKKNLHFRIFS